MHTLRSAILLVFILFAVACQPKLEEIVMGQAQCHSCRMNIVDKHHAAQFVTQKGKQFQYDSIECLIHDLKQPEGFGSPVAKSAVADFNTGNMLPAEQASYLISPGLKSPMGAGLSAFATQEEASEAQKTYGGKLWAWDDLSLALKKTEP